MNKKGFTLIELLGVIIILAVVIIIAVPTINGVVSNIQDNMLAEKKNMIEESAILYGQDVRYSILNSNKKYKKGNNATSFPCISKYVYELVPDYLEKDNDNNCLTSTSTSGNGCIVDPRDSNNYLDKEEVIIYYKNKRIHAVLNNKGTYSCS